MRKLFAFLLALAIVIYGAAVLSKPAPAGAACRAPIKILTVGDSITEGATMTGSVSPAYRAELGRLLDAACQPHEFVVAAKGGTTCNYWSDKMAGLMTTHHPDIVLINCGTNNRLDNKTPGERAAFGALYRSLFDTVVDSDPDVLAWPAWIQYSAGTTNAACTAHGPITWLRASQAMVNDELYRAMINVIDEWGDRIPSFIDYQGIPEGYLDDCGVHPTPGGYDMMGTIAYRKIAEKLGLPAVPEPCGLTGRRDGYPVPARKPCTTMGV